MKRLLTSCLLACAALLFLTMVTQAAPQADTTYYISSSSDPTPTSCTTRLGGGYSCASLRSAIIAANANPGWDTIVLSHGAVYNLTILAAGNNDATTGDLNITGHLHFNFGTVICMSNCGAVIQGGAGWNDRLIEVPTNIRVDMINVTLRNGSTPNQLGGAILNNGVFTLSSSLVMHNLSGGGGGIYNNISGTLYLMNTRIYSNSTAWGSYLGNHGGLGNVGIAYVTDSVIDQNYAAGAGGGIGTPGMLFATGSVISGNVSNNNNSDSSASGGGLWATGEGNLHGELHLTNTNFINNRTVHGYGGGLANTKGYVAYLTDVTFERNSVPGYAFGGGIYNDAQLTFEAVTIVTNTGSEGGGIMSEGGAITLAHSTLAGNIARELGGGLYLEAAATAYLHDTQVVSNNATYQGGGVFNLGLINLLGSTLNLNHSREGGGIYNSGTAWILNDTLSGNRADITGGGLFNTGPLAFLNNTTVVNNLADADANGTGEGGGVHSANGNLAAANSLIGQNNSYGVNAPDCSGPLSSFGYNLIQSTAGCTLTGTLTGNIIGQSPKIGPLQDNGGSTWTHALLADSPAINAGNPSGSFFDYCLSVDQRGVSRPIGPRCDIGAYEAEVDWLLHLPLVVR